MRALTIPNPWAWLIAERIKPVENRGWKTSHRGDIAVHAGQTVDGDALWSYLVQKATENWPQRTATPPWAIAPGAIIAVATLADICSVCSTSAGTARLAPLGQVWCSCGEWASPGDHHWQLTNVRKLAEPVPCRGRLGLWTVPADVEPLIRERVA